MILLDTNVVSEVMRPEPSTRVINWLNHPRVANLHLSAVSVAEIEFGIDVPPAGRRRQTLRTRFGEFLRHASSHRIAPFDEPATQLLWANDGGVSTRRAYGFDAGRADCRDRP